MKKFKSYEEVKAAVDQIAAIDAAIASQSDELVKSALAEKSAALKAAFTVTPRAKAKTPAPKPAPTGKK